MMRNLLIALALLVGIFSAGSADAQQVARWQNFGADPAYASHEAVLADAERVFIRAGWPARVARIMVQKMRTEPCERFELRNGDRLDTMRTGRNGMWRNVLVDFQQPRNMSLTAPSCRWKHTDADGTVYIAIEPDVCHNLATLIVRPTPVPCIYQVFWVEEEGTTVSTTDLSRTFNVTSGICAPAIAGPGTGADGRNFSAADFVPLTEDAAHPCDWRQVVNYHGVPQTSIKGCVRLKRGWHVLRLDPSFLNDASNIVLQCQTSPDGRRTTLSTDTWRQHFFRNAAGVYIATVWPSERQVPSGYEWTMLFNEWDQTRFEELSNRSRAMLAAYNRTAVGGAGH